MRWSLLLAALFWIVLLAIQTAPVYADDCGCGGGSGSGDDGSSPGDTGDTSGGSGSSGYGSAGDPAAIAAKARDLYVKGQLEESLQSYNDSLALEPYNALTLMGKGEVLFTMQRYPEAVQVYEEIVAINPTHDGAFNCLGNTYLVMREYEAAADAYERSLSLRPGNPLAEQNLQVARNLVEGGTTAATTMAPEPGATREPEAALTHMPPISAPITVPSTPHPAPLLNGMIGALTVSLSLMVPLMGRHKD
ncbi:MAG: tetratricopeptide repeat protein [Methanolinea sp.]|nr:tetratricopeptide repeat protein [Methanolinea sp.]